MTCKILIIDDYAPIRNALQRIVQREGFTPLSAQNGKEGLVLFERENPDIVISDLYMPLVDGRGVLRAVKERKPQTKVIILTGYGDQDTSDLLLKEGADRFLKKPIDLGELAKILHDLSRLPGESRERALTCLLFFQDTALREDLRQMTEKNDIHSLIAHHFDEAVGFLGEGRAEVVIMEINRSQKEFIRRLIDLKSIRRDFALLFVADADPETMVLARELGEGVCDILSLPVSEGFFVETLRKTHRQVLIERGLLYKDFFSRRQESLGLVIHSPRHVDLRLDDKIKTAALAGVSSFLDVSGIPFLILKKDLTVRACAESLRQFLGYTPFLFDTVILEKLSQTGLCVGEGASIVRAMDDWAHNGIAAGEDVLGRDVFVITFPPSSAEDVFAVVFFPTLRANKGLGTFRRAS